MKRVIFFSLLCCMLLVFFVQAGSCTTATINVVKNPSFENGLNDWKKSGLLNAWADERDDAPDGNYVLHMAGGGSPTYHKVYLCGEEIYSVGGTSWKETVIDLEEYKGKLCNLVFKHWGSQYSVTVSQEVYIPPSASTLKFYSRIHKSGIYDEPLFDNIQILVTRDYEEIQDPSFEYEIGNNPDVCWSEYELSLIHI